MKIMSIGVSLAKNVFHVHGVDRAEQQDIQAVHRIRAELVSQRIAKGNVIRGAVAEYGLVAPRQLCRLRRGSNLITSDETACQDS